jgi:group I intron endonuclease
MEVQVSRLPKIPNMLRIAGIYKIVCKITKKVYVGSAKNLQRRWLTHIRQLNNKIHHSIYLQRAWNKYGEANFVFEILEVVENPTKKKLEAREQIWMDKLQCYDFKYGFNTLHKAGSNLGRKATLKTRKLLSKVLTGRKAWNKGQKLSRNHVQNLSLAHKGKKWSRKQRSSIGIDIKKRHERFVQKLLNKYELFFKLHGYNPNQNSKDKEEAFLAIQLFNAGIHKTRQFKQRPNYVELRVINNKKELLSLAKSGGKKPSRESKDNSIRKLANVLKWYTNEKGPRFDKVFTEELKIIRPDWFVTHYDKANTTRKILLELARQGKPRPSDVSTNVKEQSLARHLRYYTLKASGSYSLKLDKQLRKLRPDWFPGTGHHYGGSIK